MARLRKLRSEFLADERGVSSVEYAVLLAFVGAGVVIGMQALSKSVGDEMIRASDCIAATTSADCPK